MTDPPRLRDLPDGDAWTRQLLRDAPKSSALTPADYARLGDRVPQTLASAGVGAADDQPPSSSTLRGKVHGSTRASAGEGDFIEAWKRLIPPAGSP